MKRMTPDSKLVTYTCWSPNHSGKRTHVIDTISIHCMAGNLSIETCGKLFLNPDREASSQYGIGGDGRIGQYVPEAYRSWCTSSRSNDQRAITIEVANSAGAPDWPVSEKAYNALLDLLTDICSRHNIKQLLWRGDPGLIGQINLQNMTVHRWFAAKACPGNYLLNRHAAIATTVNKRLKEGIDLNEAETRKVAAEVVTQQNPNYPVITDVPAYWRPAIQELIDMDIINGGTDNAVNDKDVNLTKDTIKAIVIMKAYIDAKYGG